MSCTEHHENTRILPVVRPGSGAMKLVLRAVSGAQCLRRRRPVMVILYSQRLWTFSSQKEEIVWGKRTSGHPNHLQSLHTKARGKCTSSTSRKVVLLSVFSFPVNSFLFENRMIHRFNDFSSLYPSIQPLASMNHPTRERKVKQGE